MRYSQLISIKNLDLAWRRILTSTGLQYKQLYRPLYESHEPGIQDSLQRLRETLRGAWEPTSPHRLYIPKPSGLHRPISLLRLEDQIVLQAVANAFAYKLSDRRRRVENRCVYSNILNRPVDSIFFVRRWQYTYYRFLLRTVDHFTAGRRWMVHFDLAAFYDTISHELLIKRVSPRGGDSDTWNRVRAWLERWSSDRDSYAFHHGIPQGPVASDFLAECFLLPLDEVMQEKGQHYVRYVDDIRIFASSESAARTAAARLEVQCRDLGLIPQSSKFAITEATSLEDLLSFLPSLPPDEHQENPVRTLPTAEAESLFRSSLGGRPLRVEEKTQMRFALYRAPPSRKILNWVGDLLDRNPEHIDSFQQYASKFDRSRPLERKICDILTGPYPTAYVRGCLWQILAGSGSDEVLESMKPLALAELKTSKGRRTLAAGILAFLLAGQQRGQARAAYRILHQDPMVQAWLVPLLPQEEYSRDTVLRPLLTSKAPEPGVMLARELVKRNKSHVDYEVQVREMAPEVQNVFRAVGLIYRRNVPKVDQIGTIVFRRYGVPDQGIWLTLLVSEYQHALQVLLQAEAVFDSGRNTWLLFQNSFNEITFRAVTRRLAAVGAAGGRSLVAKDGKIINYGVLLDPSAPFSRSHPNIADAFRAANNRRNALPAAHPYEQRGGGQTYFLRAREQRRLVSSLEAAYSELAALARRHR